MNITSTYPKFTGSAVTRALTPSGPQAVSAQLFAEYNVGDIITARVASGDDGRVLLLENGAVVTAPQNPLFMEGEIIALSLSAKNNGQVLLTLVSESSQSPGTEGALNRAGAEVNGNNMEIAGELKRQGVPVDSTTLGKINESLTRFPALTVRQAVFMLANHIDVNEQTVAALAAINERAGAMLDGIARSLSSQSPETLAALSSALSGFDALMEAGITGNAEETSKAGETGNAEKTAETAATLPSDLSEQAQGVNTTETPGGVGTTASTRSAASAIAAGGMPLDEGVVIHPSPSDETAATRTVEYAESAAVQSTEPGEAVQSELSTGRPPQAIAENIYTQTSGAELEIKAETTATPGTALGAKIAQSETEPRQDIVRENRPAPLENGQTRGIRISADGRINTRSWPASGVAGNRVREGLRAYAALPTSSAQAGNVGRENPAPSVSDYATNSTIEAGRQAPEMGQNNASVTSTAHPDIRAANQTAVGSDLTPSAAPAPADMLADAPASQIRSALSAAPVETMLDQTIDPESLDSPEGRKITQNRPLLEVSEKIRSMAARMDADAQASGESIRKTAREIAPRLQLMRDSAEESASGALIRQLDQLVSHIKLQQDIQQFVYMQVPFRMGAETQTAELYVLKRDARALDAENANLLVALDMEHMGKIEALIQVQKRDIRVRMRVGDENAIPKLKQSTVDLHERLMETGYHLADLQVMPIKTPVDPLNVEEVIRAEYMVRTKAERAVFDVEI